jgi:hypothetical protein
LSNASVLNPLSAHVLRLLHAIRVHLLPILGLSAIDLRLLTVLDLSAIDLRLLPLGYAMLRLCPIGMRLLPLGDTHLRTIDMLRPGLTALSAHLDVLRAPRPLHREALCVLHPRRAGGLPLHVRRSEGAATAAPLSPLCMLSAAIPLVRGRLATAPAMRSCACGGGDRQRCNACGEKHPRHDNVSFRTVKRPVLGTVPTLKRWNPHPTALV